MPPGSKRYTLAGFSSQIDWRPLEFVKPLPEYRVCSACGLVRQRTALLPCTHALCDSCYEQCAEDGGRVCPRDKRRCQEEDVDWKAFPSKELVKMLVRCWNKDNGCDHVMKAAQICMHSQRECEHHSASCPVCSAVVLCSDTCAHLKSGCGPLTTGRPLEWERQPSDMNETAILTSFKGLLEKVSKEIKEYLGRLISDTRTQSDRFNELSHGVNTLQETARDNYAPRVELFGEPIREVSRSPNVIKETIGQDPLGCMSALKDAVGQVVRETLGESLGSFSQEMRELAVTNEATGAYLASKSDIIIEASHETRQSNENLTSQLAATSSENLASLKHMSLAIEAWASEAREERKKTLDIMKQVLRYAKLNASCVEFFVKGVQSLKETALKEPWAVDFSEQVYLRGYCVTPGVFFSSDDSGSVTVHLAFRLHKGDMDDFVQWPFEQKTRFAVIHPKNFSERVVEAKGHRRELYIQRPSESESIWSHSRYLSFNLMDLERYGYVEDDQIRIKWELP